MRSLVLSIFLLLQPAVASAQLSFWFDEVPFAGGLVLLNDGSATNPSLSFVSDIDLGLYRVGDNQLGFTAGGVLKMVLTTTQLDLQGVYLANSTGNVDVGDDMALGNSYALYFGTGLDYWLRYDQVDTEFEWRSTDIDGIGTNGLLLQIDDGTDDFIFYGALLKVSPTTDTAPGDFGVLGGKAWSQATGANQVGGDLELAGGVGTRQVTIDDFAQCEGAEVGVEINGSPNTLTEGVDWNRGTSNNAAADSLAAAIDALAGVGAGDPPAAVVYVDVDGNTRTVDLTEDTAACTTLTEGEDGTVLFPSGGSYPGIGFLEGPTTGFYLFSAGVLRILSSGVSKIQIGTETKFTSNVEMGNKKIYSSSQALNLGGIYVSTEGLVTDAVIIGKDAGGKSLEVEGLSYFEATVATRAGRIINTTTVNDTNYTVLEADHLVAYTALTAARTVTLTDALCADGRTYDIKDEAGAAGTWNITIDPEGTTTIDGATTAVIDGDYNSLTVYCRGSAWFTR